MINKCFLKERLEKGEMYILGQNKVELKPKSPGGGGAVTKIPNLRSWRSSCELGRGETLGLR